MTLDSSKQPSSYAERLSRHIDDYIQSVLDSPAVRLNEFLELRDFAAVAHPARLLEVPAEGTVLETIYPKATIHRADFMKLRLADYSEKVLTTNWGLTGIDRQAYDALLAVVPFHHANAEEKQRYVAGAREVLKPGGVLAFGEVEAASPVHRFLDGFINDHTFTGHRGAYPDESFAQVLTQQGFTQVSSEVRSCPWVFDSEIALHAYMTRLFALKPLSVKALLGALSECLGLQFTDGRILMNWSLRYFRGVK